MLEQYPIIHVKLNIVYYCISLDISPHPVLFIPKIVHFFSILKGNLSIYIS